ncbi:hypothetical protein HQN60_08990 [Deefgea piscis]|uniref:Uncharacterized protein n=1 Tax=Deefgea piscis TaxID=2739061 RepID=A0A6M8STR1_9NEIS|nr:hypothetical protein [Deefgea piscis]QKJ66826.1 hypothetical protein HQN60_08990 [Deefgea piscis]
MTVNLSHFGLCMELPEVSSPSMSFRPPSWPPPKDWVCIEDRDGNPVSCYGDSIWHFYPWAGITLNFHFGDGPKLNSRSHVIDLANIELLRQLVTWRGWGPRAAINVHTLVGNFAIPLRKIISICSENNILASDLSRYPAVIDEIAQQLPKATFSQIVAELDRLRDASEFLGFELLDAAGIMRLKVLQPVHNSFQTEYIPSRIWTYLVLRIAECINDYIVHQEKIEACFEFCISAYVNNNVIAYRESTGKTHYNPFQSARKSKNSELVYLGAFVDTAERFGIKEVIERWVGRVDEKSGIRKFGAYLSLIQNVALANIVAFTMMRVEEAASVRLNCLLWYDDPVYGRVPLIQAETTKTDPDDSALWVTSPSVEPAINTLKSIAKIRLSSVGRWAEENNPLLLTVPFEPWMGGRKSAKRSGLKARVGSLGELVRVNPLLFDAQQITINENDLKIAKSVGPLNTEKFKIGFVWPIAWHQFRRTSAVNMFASGLISDPSMQFQMKHQTRLMPLYYGRGNTALRLNDAVRVLLVNSQYEVMGRQLAEVHTDRFISPYGDNHKAGLLAPANNGQPVNLISEGDAQHYEKSARRQELNFRLTALGACMKNGPCDGDCVSSIGDCAGGDGKAPCANVLFDRTNAEKNKIRLAGVIKQIEATPVDTPRYRHLEQERRGLENYFAYIRNEI